MNHIDLEEGLFETLKSIPVIDCHEHLPPEKVRVSTRVDALTFFRHYNRFDLVNAGMKPPPAGLESLFSENIPYEKKWRMIKPYFAHIRHTTYAKAALISLKHFYGFDDFTDATCGPITEAMRKANKKGIYDRVFDACNIKLALTQCQRTKLDNKRLIPLMPMMHQVENWELINTLENNYSHKIRINTLEDYIESAGQYIKQVKKEGAIGVKTFPNPRHPDRKAALDAFNGLKTGRIKLLPLPNPLNDYVFDELLRIAGEENMVVAVHTGYWGDFRALDPLHMIPALTRHKNVKFDIYHLGHPWIRETIQLGRNFPNVWLNLCCHAIMSENANRQAIDEIIDQIPSNKILGFGGDYVVPEKIYGHLTIARRNFARVFAERIARNDMTERQAVQVLKRWLWDNPIELYGLKNKM